MRKKGDDLGHCDGLFHQSPLSFWMPKTVQPILHPDATPPKKGIREVKRVYEDQEARIEDEEVRKAPKFKEGSSPHRTAAEVLEKDRITYVTAVFFRFIRTRSAKSLMSHGKLTFFFVAEPPLSKMRAGRL